MIDIIGGGKGKSGNMVSSIISLAIIICIIILVVKIYKAMAAGTSVIGQQLGDQTTSIETGIPAARVAFIRAKAKDLWTQGVTSYMFGTLQDYDEDYFINGINSMANTKELGLLNEYFKQNHKHGWGLAAVILDSFNSSEIARLKTGYYAFLQSI